MKKALLGTALAVLAGAPAFSQTHGTGVAPSSLPAAPVAAPWPAVTGIQVASGCGLPAASAHSWYVDPVLGKPTNSGASAPAPWDLATALHQAWSASGGMSGIANPVVHLGDTFLLASGNYGDLLLQGYYSSQIGYDNKTRFLTIKAAAGATPVFSSIQVVGAGGWVFQGLTVRQIASRLPTHSYGALVQIEGDNHDIIFSGNTIQSAASVTGWSQANWLTNGAVGIAQTRADPNGMKCLSITNNTISNVGSGIQTSHGTSVLIANNTLNYFTHDGIDYASNNLVIQHNLLTNRIDAGDVATTHPDFMQGQPPDSSTYSNILIDSNIAIRQSDPNMPFAAQTNPTTNTQGIDEFDGNWSNIAVTNNVLVTRTTNGIAFSNVAGLTLANNTVLCDGITQYCPELGVFIGKNGGFSTNVTISNNMAASLVVAKTMPLANVKVANNAVFRGGNFEWSGNSNYWDNSPGSLPNGNQILALYTPGLFENLTIVNGAVAGFDLNLVPGTPVVGKGTTTGAPANYITGAARAGAINLGAYPTSP